MAETNLCGRVGCGEPAAGVLLMAAQDRKAWLVALDHPFAPDGVSLCAVHADRITVPLGWSLDDERPAVKPRRSRKRKPRTSAKDVTVASAAPTPAARDISDQDAHQEQEGTEATSSATGSAPRVAEESDAAPEGRPRKAKAETQKTERAKSETAKAESALGSEAAHHHDSDTPGAEAAAAGQDHLDEPTVQLPAVRLDHPSSPAQVPLNADAPAAAVDDNGRRLSVVPGEDDPNKTFDFEDDGQGALWAPEGDDAREPDERTPLLKRAFRVVRDD